MSDYFDRIERQLTARINGTVSAGAGAGEAGRRRSRRRGPGRRAWAVLGPIAAVAVVAVVVAVIVTSGGHARRAGTAPGLSVHRRVSLTLHAPAATAPAKLVHAAAIVRARMRALGISGHVVVHGHSLVISDVPGKDAGQVTLLGVPGRLSFYDWEDDVLLPSGDTVAARLPGGHDPTALEISQGDDRGAPGAPAAGAVTLYRAVSLAARQPMRSYGPRTSELFLFGTGASAACRRLADQDGARPREVIADGHCLLAGPASTAAQLRAELPAGIAISETQQLSVGRGTTVVQAVSPAASPTPTVSSAARFYVLHDRSVLSGAGLNQVQAANNSAGQPGVTFGFTPAGARAFQDVTATVAHRGATVSVGPAVLPQHFAIALDGRLLSVPSIDYKQYPDGVVPRPGSPGGEITGDLTARSARQLAAILRGGPLGVTLSASRQPR